MTIKRLVHSFNQFILILLKDSIKKRFKYFLLNNKLYIIDITQNKYKKRHPLFIW